MGILSWLRHQFSSKEQFSNGSLREIAIEEDGGFVDLTIPLASYKRLTDGTQICEAKGTYAGKELGFNIRLPEKWKQGTLGDSITTYAAALHIESLGTSSDNFLSALANLYGEPLISATMPKSVPLPPSAWEEYQVICNKGRQA